MFRLQFPLLSKNIKNVYIFTGIHHNKLFEKFENVKKGYKVHLIKENPLELVEKGHNMHLKKSNIFIGFFDGCEILDEYLRSYIHLNLEIPKNLKIFMLFPLYSEQTINTYKFNSLINYFNKITYYIPNRSSDNYYEIFSSGNEVDFVVLNEYECFKAIKYEELKMIHFLKNLF